MTPDHNPILGFVEEGLLVAAGFSGHGVQQAAMVGRLMAEEVAFGQAQSLDLTPFLERPVEVLVRAALLGRKALAGAGHCVGACVSMRAPAEGPWGGSPGQWRND